MKYPRVDATHFSQFLAPTRALCSIAPTEFGQSDRTRKLIRLLDFKAKSKKTRRLSERRRSRIQVARVLQLLRPRLTSWLAKTETQLDLLSKLSLGHWTFWEEDDTDQKF